ncbi:hypothetical protein EC973_000120 [Apophysomyces ossiformis]|uniref:Uncharacterized protein n=1 Tax=Apophysomyces ossiformis TaxID=679940 RepID=A0A8H7BZV1_9FUNG|nr:hypothetical protein EC973_000120 [Apophysomyces ossiformis]
MEDPKRVVFDEETLELARFFQTTGPSRKPSTEDILGRMTRLLRRKRQQQHAQAPKKYIMLPAYPPPPELEPFSSISLEFPKLPPSPAEKMKKSISTHQHQHHHHPMHPSQQEDTIGTPGLSASSSTSSTSRNTSTDTAISNSGSMGDMKKKGVDMAVQTVSEEEMDQKEQEKEKNKRRLSSPPSLPSGALLTPFIPTTEEAKVLLKMIEQLRAQLLEEQRSRKTLEQAMSKKDRRKNVEL